MKRMAIYLFVALVSACASAPPETPKSSKILVVSLLGNTLKLRQVGITVFGNSEQSLDVHGWSVDAHVESFAGKLLTDSGRQVQKTPENAATEIGPLSYVAFTQSNSFRGGPAGVKSVASKVNADYVVLIDELQGWGDPFFRTNQIISGYGVYQRRGAGSIAYASIRTLLVNGKTGEIISFKNGAESSPRSDEIWLDLSKPEISINSLGQPAAVFLSVIDN